MTIPLDQLILARPIVVHRLRRIYDPRDPDTRSEARAYCDATEELSGSGRHHMAIRDADVTCLRCAAAMVRAEEP